MRIKKYNNGVGSSAEVSVKLKMAGAASLYRDRDRRLELAAQRETNNNSELGHDRKLQIQETMDWAAHGNVPVGGGHAALNHDSYEHRRPSNIDKFQIG